MKIDELKAKIDAAFREDSAEIMEELLDYQKAKFCEYEKAGYAGKYSFLRLVERYLDKAILSDARKLSAWLIEYKQKKFTAEEIQEKEMEEFEIELGIKEACLTERFENFNGVLELKKDNVDKIAAANVGELVIFGLYPYDEEGKISGIAWRVLKKNEDEVLLLTENAIDVRPYHSEWGNITWEDSEIRTWLNDSFFKMAFSEEEQKMVKISNLENKDNEKYEVSGGNATADEVFLLSIEEADNLFETVDDRPAIATEYLKSSGAFTTDNYATWWLRSPGCYENNAAGVNYKGVVSSIGHRVDFTSGGIRPAIRIKVK